MCSCGDAGRVAEPARTRRPLDAGRAVRGAWAPIGPPVHVGMTDAGAVGGFTHVALCHRSTAELAETLVPVLSGWLGMDDTVVVNLSSARLAALKAAMSGVADRVHWSDTRTWHPHPARRLRAIQELVDAEARHGGAPLRFVGECAFPASPPERVAEWGKFDAILNDALASAPVTMVCTYDVRALPAEAVCTVPRSHPLLGLDPVTKSTQYVEPAEYLSRGTTSLSPIPACAHRIVGRVTPGDARALVGTVLSSVAADPASTLPSDAVEELAVATTELVTNAWQAGATSIGVSCWRTDGEAGVQVDDDGPGLDDPFAGYRRPSPGATGGRGLWISRQLTDLLEVASGPAGTSVRVRVFDDVGALFGP